MTHVVVLADDACIRFTCAEVLAHLGFQTTLGEVRGLPAVTPDAILLWDSDRDDVSATHAAYPGVPVLLCTWDHRRAWPGADAVVQLPFNAARVARTLSKLIRANQLGGRPASAA